MAVKYKDGLPYYDIDDPAVQPTSSSVKYKDGLPYYDADEIDYRQASAFHSFTTELGKGLVRGTLNVANGIIGTAEWLIPGKQESLIGAQERLAEGREEFPMTHKGAAAWGGRILGEALPYMGASTVGGLTGGGAAGAAGLGIKGINAGKFIGGASIGFAVEGQDAYERAKARGATEEEANTDRLIVGTINAAIEGLQVTRLLKFKETGKHSLKSFINNVRNKAWDKAGGQAAKFGADILRLSIEEGIEEALQEGVSLSVPGISRDDWLRKPDGSVDVWGMGEQIGEAALGGMFAGGIIGGGLSVTGSTNELSRASEAEIQKVAERIRNSSLNDVEKNRMLRELEGMRTKPESIPEAGGLVLEEAVVKDSLTTERGEIISFDELPDRAKGAIAGEARTKNRPASAFTSSVWEKQTVDIESLRDKNPGVWSDKFTLRGSMTKGPIVVSESGEVLDGNNRLREAIDRGDGTIEVLRRVNAEPSTKTEQAKPKTEGYVPLIQEELTPEEQLRSKVDEVVAALEKLRPAEAEAISLELGKRFGEFRNILEDVKDPQARVPMAMQALSGVLKQMIDPLSERFTKEEIDAMYDIITTSTLLTEGEMIAADSGLTKMMFGKRGLGEGLYGQIPAKHELRALQKAGILSKEAIQDLLKHRTKWQKAKQVMHDIAMAPWSILTSYDLSFTRQGWMMMFKKPGMWASTMGRAWRMLLSEDYFNYIELKRKTHPYYAEAIKRGVEETTLENIGTHEEMFSSTLVQKLPGIHPSARAFVGALNELRFNWYFSVRESNEGLGLNAKQQKDLATLANDLTGRGKVPKALQKLQNTGLIFFAPRLQMARLRTPADLVMLGSPARKLMAGTLVKFLGMTLATLWLLDRDDDITVEWNPKSSDFLKVKYKNARVDITGGYQQLIRYTAQMITGERKSTSTGKSYEADRKDVFSQFLQSKLSPHAGLVVDLWRGETFKGEKLRMEPGPVAKQFYERLTPLFIQDVADAIKFQGLGTATAIAPLAFHGIGVQTYPKTIGQENFDIKDRLAKQFFGVGWDELGPEAQQGLREYNPQIMLNEIEAKKEREDFDFLGKLQERADEAGRKIEKGLPSPVQRALEDNYADIGSLSRKAGARWYMNDATYSRYQKDVKFALTKYLSLLVNNKQFNRLPPDMKRAALQETIDQIKSAARKQIVLRANISDLRSWEQMRSR